MYVYIYIYIYVKYIFILKSYIHYIYIYIYIHIDSYVRYQGGGTKAGAGRYDFVVPEIAGLRQRKVS